MGVPNIEFSVFDSAARGKVLYATLTSAELINLKWRGVRLFLVISAAQGTSPTFDLKLQSKDPNSGAWIDLTGASFAQQVSTQAGLDFTVYPGITVVANRSIANLLSRIWRASVAIGGTTNALATTTLTSDATAPSNNDTVTLGTPSAEKVYTFKTALTEATAANTLTSDATAPTTLDTVTLNTTVYTFKTALTETRASATLTSNATQVTAGDTFTIGYGANRKTYTLVSALSSPAIPNEILFETSAAVTLDNIKLAITQTSGSGTKWSANTEKHPTIDATTNTDTTQLFIARTAGQAGNVFESTETAVTLSFGGVVFTGGVDAVANQVLIGVSAAVALDNLKLAVTAGARTDQAEEYSTGTVVHPTINATTNTDTTQLFVAKVVGTVPNTYPTTEASTHLSFPDTTLGGASATVIGVASIANEVLIGASAAAALDNIKSAVNGTAGSGSTYSTATVAATVFTATTNTDTTQVFQAVLATVPTAAAQNLLTSTEAGSHTSFGAATFLGAIDEAQFTFSLGGVYLV
jgi:hypothetical protein